jgi:hypothetical protein
MNLAKYDDTLIIRLTERCGNRSLGHGIQPPQDGGSASACCREGAAGRRATESQVLEDAERLIAAWNERQSRHMPMLFSSTIGVAITACPPAHRPFDCVQL